MANDVNLEIVSSTDSCHSSDEVAATEMECSSDSEEDHSLLPFYCRPLTTPANRNKWFLEVFSPPRLNGGILVRRGGGGILVSMIKERPA